MHIIINGRDAFSAVMSGFEEHDRVAQVSVDDQAIIRQIVNQKIIKIECAVRQKMVETIQEVLRSVAQ